MGLANFVANNWLRNNDHNITTLDTVITESLAQQVELYPISPSLLAEEP